MFVTDDREVVSSNPSLLLHLESQPKLGILLYLRPCNPSQNSLCSVGRKITLITAKVQNYGF